MWRLIPLSKRKLLTLGPLVPGRSAANLAAVVIAGELAHQGVPRDVCIRLLARMPFTPDSTPEREVRRGFAYFIDTGYRDRRLTGCRCTGSTSSTLPVYGDYCEGNCLVRSSTTQRIDTSPFGATYRSAIWTKLGPLAHHVYGQLLLDTLARPHQPIAASASYIAATRLHHRHDRRAVSRALHQLEAHGLVASGTKRGEQHHRRLVHLTAEQVGQLEQQVSAAPPRHAEGTPTSIDLAAVVTRSAYQPVAHSSIWAQAATARDSHGLGAACREVYYQLAALAARDARSRRPITITASDLAARLDGHYTTRTINTLLRKLAAAGVIRRTGSRILVRKLTAAQVAQLEERLGTRRIVADNEASVRREQLAALDERQEWADAQQLVNGTAWATRRATPTPAEEAVTPRRRQGAEESLADRSTRILAASTSLAA